jgi:hypothetical protein
MHIIYAAQNLRSLEPDIPLGDNGNVRKTLFMGRKCEIISDYFTIMSYHIAVKLEQYSNCVIGDNSVGVQKYILNKCRYRFQCLVVLSAGNTPPQITYCVEEMWSKKIIPTLLHPNMNV